MKQSKSFYLKFIQSKLSFVGILNYLLNFNKFINFRTFNFLNNKKENAVTINIP
jgi:hypothetical protein